MDVVFGYVLVYDIKGMLATSDLSQLMKIETPAHLAPIWNTNNLKTDTDIQ